MHHGMNVVCFLHGVFNVFVVFFMLFIIQWIGVRRFKPIHLSSYHRPQMSQLSLRESQVLGRADDMAETAACPLCCG